MHTGSRIFMQNLVALRLLLMEIGRSYVTYMFISTSTYEGSDRFRV